MADRVRLVRGVLPPGIPAAARVGALAFGILLIWLSRSLARRRRRAWQLAVVVVARLGRSPPREGARLRGGDNLAAAARRARALAAPVRRAGRPRVDAAAARDPRRRGRPASRSWPASSCTAARSRTGSPSSSTALALLFGFSALYLWLRPFSQAVAQTVGERSLARALVDAYGSDSLSFFALRRDKSYFFSPTRRAFLAYRVVAGAALVSGDPVGAEEEFDALLAEFQPRRTRERVAPRRRSAPPTRSSSATARSASDRSCSARRR